MKNKNKIPSFPDQQHHQELEKYIRKMCVKKNVCKAQEWGGMYQTYKHINLNKIRRSNKRVAEDKESLERNINDS